MTVGMALGGLASGLANGMALGMQMKAQQGYLDMQKQHQDRMDKADQRDAEIHDLRKDQYGAEKEVRDRRNRALQQIADYTTNAFGGNQQQVAPVPTDPNTPNAPSLGAAPSPVQVAGPVPQGSLSAIAPTGTQQPQQQQPADKPAKVLEKGMVTGMYSPKMLTDIAGIFAQNGLHEEGIKYMNQAYEAQKRGAVQVASAFLQNNPGDAAKALQSAGMQLDGPPVKVKPDDPNDHNWKLKIAGQGEKTVNVKDWLQSTMDPEEFFKEQDRQRKAALDERKQANDDKTTAAQVGYLRSRSTLAEANADKADRSGQGGLAPSRSTEAQINTALSRRDKAFDRVSSVKNEEGKFEVDPTKRQTLDSASNQYQDFLENQLGHELDARQHHKFTDAMVTFPVGGSKEQIKEWEKTQLIPRFGGRPAQSDQPAQAAPQQAAPAQGLAPTPQAPAGSPPGSLASLQEKARTRQAVIQEMDAVQNALKTPNLSVEQKKSLALKAQEIAARRDSLK